MKGFILTLIFYSFCAAGAEKLILKSGSDIDSTVTDYYLEVSEGKMNSLRLIMRTDGRIDSDITYSMEDLMDGGAVIVHREGRDIIRLVTEDFTIENGGNLIFDFLYNGLTGSRAFLKTRLVRVDGEFMYLDQENNHINRMTNIGNRKMGKVIGIKYIKTSQD